MKLPVTTLLPQRSNRSGPARFPRVCIACIPVLLSLVSFAQIEQKGRVEISPKAYKITLAGEKGIIAYNVDSNYVGSYGQNRLQFIRYDTNMVRKYIVEHFIPGRLHFEQTYLDDTYFYLLFNNPRHSRIAIFRLDILSSVGEWIPGNSLVRHLQVTDFKVMQSQALIAGRIKANDNPVVLSLISFTNSRGYCRIFMTSGLWRKVCPCTPTRKKTSSTPPYSISAAIPI
jgi:hypothetical protein